MSVSAAKRKKYAVVKAGGENKFPIFSVHSAKSALRLINHAKPPLTSSQKAAVRRKAAKYGVKPSKKS